MLLFLLASIAGVIAVIVLFLAWRYVDHSINQAAGDDTITALQAALEEALEQQRALTTRVEHLEAIIATDDADVRDPLTSPGEREDLSNEALVARRAQRQKRR
jgi:phage shock protein B